jgi:hypothetical protein
MSPKEFELLACDAMSTRFGVPLAPGSVPGVPKLFDMVSSDRRIVGDAKYLTLVGGKRTPPAKLSMIAEHVWLLEKAPAERTFLVFGNQIAVPQLWLEKYGLLVPEGMGFFFLHDSGRVEELPKRQPPVTGKYSPLLDYFRRAQVAVVDLTFTDIERIIGASLPRSSSDHHAWWHGVKFHPHCVWELCGFSAHPDLSKCSVRFENYLSRSTA